MSMYKKGRGARKTDAKDDDNKDGKVRPTTTTEHRALWIQTIDCVCISCVLCACSNRVLSFD